MAITFLKVTNRAVSTLDANINDSVTSLDVISGDGALFPSTYPFHITIDDEILSCTLRATDTLTVTREVQSTTAAAHTAGASVELRLTAKHLDDITDDLTRLGGYLVEKNVAYTATTSDNIIVVDATSGSITISLPAAADSTNYEYTIKKIDSSSNAVIVDADSNETIDGEKTVELISQYSYVTVVSDGDEWFILGGVNVKLEDLLVQQLGNQEEIIEVLRDIETHLALGSGEELNKEESG